MLKGSIATYTASKVMTGAASRFFSTAAGKIESTTLQNGLRVVSLNTGAPNTSLNVIVQAGSRYESATTRGASQVSRNLAFLGVPEFNQVLAARELELFSFEASSARETVSFSAQFNEATKEDTADYLSLLSQILSRKPEYWRVKDAKKRIETDPINASDLYLDVAHRVAYRSSGLGNSLVFQDTSSIVSDHNAVAGYLAERFTPETTVVVAIGGTSHSAIVDAAQKSFGSAASPATSLPKVASTYAGGESIYSGQGPAHLVFAFEGPSILDKDFYAAEILKALLGGGQKGIKELGNGTVGPLNKNLVEKHPWALFARAFNFGYSDSGLFGVYAVGNAGSADVLATNTYAQIKSVQKLIETPEAFARAQQQVLTSTLSLLEDSKSLANVLAQRTLAKAPLSDFVKETTEAVSAQTPATVKEAANKILSKPLTLVGGGDVSFLPSIRQLQA